MPTNRDNFTEDTKSRAARRVGFLCSKPDCRCHTVGPSAESGSAVSNIGVAAHICAAAPGGRRYDPKMTPEERMSIDNCIWLCQTHAHLIDTDETTYTVELLKHWKSGAEEYAARAISDGNFLRNYHAGNGDNLTQLEELLKSMINLGEFYLMDQILAQYTSGLSEKYDECILRNKITWCVYCNRTNLEMELEKYRLLPDKAGISNLLRLFLSFGMTNEMKALREYCNEKDLEVLIDLAISGGLADLLLGKTEPIECIEVSQVNKDAVDKYLLYLLCTNGIFGFQNREGIQSTYEHCEMYWAELWNAYSIIASAAGGVASIDQIAVQFEQLIKKVGVYDPVIQSLFWDMALCLTVQHKETFEKLYQGCPEKVRNVDRIRRARLAWTIEHESKSVSVDELLAYCATINDYYLVVQYCEKLDSQSECLFLDEHQYLYRLDSRFLHRRVVVHRDSLTMEPSIMLEKYKDSYREDFLYDCLLADQSSCDQTRQAALERLKQCNSGVPLITLCYYAKILCNNSQWEALIALSRRSMPAEMQHYLADSLATSQDADCLARGIEIYESLITSGYVAENLHHNLAVGYMMLGRTENAKNELMREYDAFRSDSVLGKLLALRYETNDFVEDTYLQTAKSVSSWRTQNVVGAHYAKMGQHDKARKYFLRSLLIEEQANPSATGYWNACRKAQDIKPSQIGVDTAFSISSDDETLYFAIHSPQVLDNITPNQYAAYSHYSSQSPEVAMFMYCQEGDLVEYNGKEYEIDEIEYIDDPLSRYAFSQIMKLPSSQVITGSSPEEALEQIIAIMKEQKEANDTIISNYNEMQIRLPLSLLAHQFGRSRLITWEFLSYVNDRPIRNNIVFPSGQSKKVFILTYDSIMTLSRLESVKSWSDDVILLCPAQVKNQLLSDINEEMEQLDESKTAGNMQYTDEGLRFIEHTNESRRARYTVLVKLKSFLTNLTDASPANMLSDDGRLRDFVTEAKLRCETGSLALAQNTEGSILITDDQFLQCAANFFGIENAGITFLVSQLGMKWNELLVVSDKLKDLNFRNYFPVGLYKTVFDMMSKDEDIQSGRALGDWLTGNPEELTDRHKEIVIQLYREVVQSGEDYLNPGNVLGQLALHFYESMHPGFLESIAKRAMEGLKIEITQETMEEESP